MELFIFASLYQAKEVLYFYTYFFIELSIYVPGRSGFAFPSYKPDFGGEKFRCLRTLSGAALSRLRKAESYI